MAKSKYCCSSVSAGGSCSKSPSKDLVVDADPKAKQNRGSAVQLQVKSNAQLKLNALLS